MLNSEKIILGIDPGYADNGFGVIKKIGNTIKFVDCGSIKTSPDQEFGARLVQVYDQVQDLIAKYSPDLVGVEKLYFSKNTKTALDVGQARGVILLAIERSGKTLLELTPNQIKQALTSSGGASKRQVGQMVKTILSLNAVPKPDDAADALAAAIAASFINTKLIVK